VGKVDFFVGEEKGGGNQYVGREKNKRKAQKGVQRGKCG